MNLSKQLREALVSEGQMITKNSSTIKQLIRKLIKIRNSLLTTLYKSDEVCDRSRMFEKFTKDDFVKMTEMTNKLQGTKHVNPHNLWGFKVRDKSTDEYPEDLLSDQEEV